MGTCCRPSHLEGSDVNADDPQDDGDVDDIDDNKDDAVDSGGSGTDGTDTGFKSAEIFDPSAGLNTLEIVGQLSMSPSMLSYHMSDKPTSPLNGDSFMLFADY